MNRRIQRNGPATGTLYLYVMEYFVDRRIVSEREVGRDIERKVEREVIQKPIYAATIEAAIVIMNRIYEQNKLGHLHKSLDRYPDGITINGIRYEPTQPWTAPVFDDDGKL